MMKLLVGETEPTEGVGEVWQHHNLRLAYIAQHSMHHLEAALENTPLEYIQNRFYKGRDKELAKLTTMALTEEEMELKAQRGSVLAVSTHPHPRSHSYLCFHGARSRMQRAANQ
jgi:elongation factor 3